jgi:L-serine dehydratase
MNSGIELIAADRLPFKEMNPLSADHISPLDMFKIGVGPSSSHTVGPMVAALEFRAQAASVLSSLPEDCNVRMQVELFGSLSATGQGHSTDKAVCAGLAGLHPRTADPRDIWAVAGALAEHPAISLAGRMVNFAPDKDIIWQGWLLDGNALPHPNTMRFRLFAQETFEGPVATTTAGAHERARGDAMQSLLLAQVILSVGGGFVEPVDPATGLRREAADKDADIAVPYPYNSAAAFVEQCVRNKLQPWEIVVANEEARNLSESDLRAGLAAILETMSASIERGLAAEGILPGGLNVRRRAKSLYEQLREGKAPAWAGNDLRPSVYAMAVNEENAAGGRVVTAPTNGSSGIIPSVWRYLGETQNLEQRVLENGLITASVIGALVKVHASISGAEVGCQGEVGTSCAMAAGGATAMLGGTPYQIEQAAEIGIEHHLGMTCDPIKGLVQVPCIERNAMGAVKALNAAALALASDGQHLVSLDRALQVMKETGLDMNQKYKETSTGGLALG